MPLLCSPERNRLYGSTFSSKLSFKAHLGVLRIFSMCQLIWGIPLQMSCFPTVQPNKTILGTHCDAGVVTLQRYKGKQDVVPVCKRLRVKWERQKDKCKTAYKDCAKEPHGRAGHLHLGAGVAGLNRGGAICAVFCLYSSLFPLFVHPTPFPSLVLLRAINSVYVCHFACIVFVQNIYCHFMFVNLVFKQM